MIYYLYRTIWHVALKAISKGFLWCGAQQVWVRNSFLLGHDQAFKSDLDLTLLIDDLSTSRRKLQKGYGFLKFFFPMLGELNCYRLQNFHLFSSLINHYELLRDPKLAEFFILKSRPCVYQKLLFLIRHIENDLDNISVNKRQEKWTFYLKIIDLDFDQNLCIRQNIESSLEVLIEKAGLKNQGLRLNYFFIKPKKIWYQSDESFYYFIFYPHRWLADALHSGELPQKLNVYLPRIGESERKILYYAISWEIFGLYSQCFVSYQSTMLEHLANLNKITSFFELWELSDHIANLENIINTDAHFTFEQ